MKTPAEPGNERLSALTAWWTGPVVTTGPFGGKLTGIGRADIKLAVEEPHHDLAVPPDIRRAVTGTTPDTSHAAL